MDIGNLEGLIPLTAGIMTLLIVFDKINIENKDFVKKRCKLLLVCGFGCICFGTATLLGLFNPSLRNDCFNCAEELMQHLK